MLVVDARNVNDAYVQGLRALALSGVPSGSRAGNVVALPHPVMTVYRRPWERVLLNEQRDANPFFHLFEALWMLAGRNDGRWLDTWVRNFSSRFADLDDGVIHGAYGHRWRSRPMWGDQLATAARLLRDDPNDRRVVVAMWDPATDLATVHRDVPCLAGETVLWSPEGDLPIREVAARFDSGELARWPVYAVDEVSKRVSLQWATRVWRSGRRKLLRITFSDGSVIRCTPDHILYRRGARAAEAVPVEAGSLQSGVRVLATRRWTGPKGHETFKRQLGDNTSFSNMVPTHQEYARLVLGVVPPGHDVHHLNEDKRDNRWENLEVISHGEHSRRHRLIKNPMRYLTPEQHAARAVKQAASLRETWARRKEEMADNHVVVSVEEDVAEDVYDFTVPEGHTALVGTGIVVHNCNTHIYPRIVDGRLDLTVMCRSNDAIWGAYGANAVHFSVLQEWMAAQVGVPVGRMYQLSNNFHAYLNVLGRVGVPDEDEPNPYATRQVISIPMVTSPGEWDTDLAGFMEDPAAEEEYANPWFSTVAQPMFLLHRGWREGRTLVDIPPGTTVDWFRAGLAWVQRRKKGEQGKPEDGGSGPPLPHVAGEAADGR